MEKCQATGKVVFSSLLEARIVMFNLKWGFKRHKDLFGKRIKHRRVNQTSVGPIIAFIAVGFISPNGKRITLSNTRKKWMQNSANHPAPTIGA